jgi:pyridoxamine 5'-phosphate oxidase
MKLYDTRDEYTNDRLADPEDEPYRLFETWYAEALAKEPHSTNAMSVVSVDPDGQPWSRMVLLKALENGAFVFFTNMTSTKASQIFAHSKVCLHFYWKALHRQVQVHGIAHELSRAESVSYFLSRPLESQISAWVSEQSRPLASRQTLLEKLAAFRANLPQPMTAPQHWGGFRVQPSRIEFWQGAEHRLHHRVVFAGEPKPVGPTTFSKGVLLNP